MSGERKQRKTYRAHRLTNRGLVMIKCSAGSYPLSHHVRHSPDGFEWGYCGSGPAELARCILLDHFDVADDEGLPVSYQDFKAEVVAHWDRDGWSLTSEQIDAWVESKTIRGVTSAGTMVAPHAQAYFGCQTCGSVVTALSDGSVSDRPYCTHSFDHRFRWRQDEKGTWTQMVPVRVEVLP